MEQITWLVPGYPFYLSLSLTQNVQLVETNATIWHHGALDSCQLINFYSLAAHLLAKVLHKLHFSWQPFPLPETILYWAYLSSFFFKWIYSLPFCNLPCLATVWMGCRILFHYQAATGNEYFIAAEQRFGCKWLHPNYTKQKERQKEKWI